MTAIKVRPSSASLRFVNPRDEECNLQVLETVYLMGSSFPRKRVYQCSHGRARAYVGGPNLLTWYGIYQYLVEINPQACEHLAGYAFPLTKQAKQEMLGADVVVLETLLLFLGELHGCAGPFSETIEVPNLIRACCGSLPTGASPLVTCQPSADRANNMLRCHLLILSVSVFSITLSVWR